MTKFDFITDETLRKSLEADSNEVKLCFDQGAWKGVHVLAGSIIETLLVDYLISSRYKPATGEDLLKFDMGRLIEACKKQGALSDKVRDLSVAVKSYRNLIHPGRLIRLKEKIDRNSATVARALMDMIIDEISATKTRQYGFTAEQIISKIEKDPTCLSIFPHLLKETKEHEIFRVLMAIPEKCFVIRNSEWLDENDYLLMERLARCFRLAFDASTKESKVQTAHRFATVMKEEGHDKVIMYEEEFFRATDLEYMVESDRSMVAKHLLTGLEEKRSAKLIAALSGIEKFLDRYETTNLIDSLVKEFIYGKDEALKTASRGAIFDLWQGTPAPADEVISRRLEQWKELFEKKQQADQVNQITELLNTFIAF